MGGGGDEAAEEGKSIVCMHGALDVCGAVFFLFWVCVCLKCARKESKGNWIVTSCTLGNVADEYGCRPDREEQAGREVQCSIAPMLHAAHC